VALVFTRQGVPYQQRTGEQRRAIARGGYVLRDCEGEPELILIATGSEVGLAAAAMERLSEGGRRVRLVSMPCTTMFESQDEAYREAVLPAAVTRRVAIEAGVGATWHRYVGAAGRVVGIERFGESAPAKVLFQHYGYTVDNVCAVAESLF
jgi:transketolase